MADLTDLSSEDRGVALAAIRDALAANLLDAEPKEVASIAKQLRETIRELEQVAAPREESVVDDLAARRAARRTGTEDS